MRGKNTHKRTNAIVTAVMFILMVASGVIIANLIDVLEKKNDTLTAEIELMKQDFAKIYATSKEYDIQKGAITSNEVKGALTPNEVKILYIRGLAHEYVTEEVVE